MANRSVESSPQRYARMGGALYLAIIVLGAFAEGVVTNKLIVLADAATTAHNIQVSSELWRLGVAADFIVVLCAVPFPDPMAVKVDTLRSEISATRR
jgi:uncharacterized protein DUF4386